MNCHKCNVEIFRDRGYVLNAYPEVLTKRWKCNRKGVVVLYNNKVIRVDKGLFLPEDQSIYTEHAVTCKGMKDGKGTV